MLHIAARRMASGALSPVEVIGRKGPIDRRLLDADRVIRVLRVAVGQERDEGQHRRGQPHGSPDVGVDRPTDVRAKSETGQGRQPDERLPVVLEKRGHTTTITSTAAALSTAPWKADRGERAVVPR